MMISQVESFPCPDKQGTPEEGRRIKRPKRWGSTNNNKDEDNSPKNHTKNIAYFLMLIYVMFLNVASMQTNNTLYQLLDWLG